MSKKKCGSIYFYRSRNKLEKQKFEFSKIQLEIFSKVQKFEKSNNKKSKLQTFDSKDGRMSNIIFKLISN